MKLASLRQSRVLIPLPLRCSARPITGRGQHPFLADLERPFQGHPFAGVDSIIVFAFSMHIQYRFKYWQIILMAVSGLAIITILLYFFCPKPALTGFYSYSRAYTDKNSRLLRLTLAADDQYRLYVPHDRISPLVRDATVLYEDQGFFHHGGVDAKAVLRAFWDTYVARKRKIGASTITMQVARMRWQIKSQTLLGKLIQMARAIQLSRHYSKEDILEAYLNLAPYGRNIQGIAAASLIYFDKSADNLTLPEALALCVIPQNPVKRNPTTARGIAELQKARAILFKRWIAHHKGDGGMKVFMELPLEVQRPQALPFAAPHLIDDLERRLPGGENGWITTTLDLNRQALLEQMVRQYVKKRKRLGISNAVAMLLNYHTMEVEAHVGSADFFNREISGQVNGAKAKRSPGSALKPFVYALAMDQGLIHPMTLLKDAPKRFAGFTPENFDQRFMGPLSARDALIASRNIPAVHLMAALEKQGFYEFLRKAGIRDLASEAHYGLSLVLGGAEVSMEELVSLYATLANGGRWQPVQTLSGGKEKEPKQLLSPEACFMVLDILKDNPPPQGGLLPGQAGFKRDIAWKTGTSYAFRDAWAVGISGPYVLAVWVGNFNGSGNPGFVGRTAAGPLLYDIFAAIQENRDWHVTDILSPSALNLEKTAVCATSGDLPGKYCPVQVESWFVPGVSPIKVDTIHRAIPIDKKTGLRSCQYDPVLSEMKVYEFWSSDLLHVFQMAGISLKTPPPFQPGCGMDRTSAAGQAPVIQSPQPYLTYVLQAQKLPEEKIPFAAVVDADVAHVYWFVNSRFAGRAKKGAPFFWQPENGEFEVRVVDDHGRTDLIRLTVTIK